MHNNREKELLGTGWMAIDKQAYGYNLDSRRPDMNWNYQNYLTRQGEMH
jgi:hypothetical protein